MNFQKNQTSALNVNHTVESKYSFMPNGKMENAQNSLQRDARDFFSVNKVVKLSRAAEWKQI